jgi:hypothetical protein
MKNLLLFFILVIGFSAFSQEEEGHFHKNELGISMAPVFFIPSEEVSFGLHAHYVKNIKSENFGIGLGAEYIFNEEKHQTYSVVFDYRLIGGLHVIAAPGVAIESELEKYEAVFAVHLETNYEFELKHFNLGPSFEFAWDPHDIHYNLGIHVAIPFE